MVKIKVLDFEECYADSMLFEDGDLKIRTIQKSDLIKAKKSAGRAKDLNDLENIESRNWSVLSVIYWSHSSEFSPPEGLGIEVVIWYIRILCIILYSVFFTCFPSCRCAYCI